METVCLLLFYSIGQLDIIPFITSNSFLFQIIEGALSLVVENRTKMNNLPLHAAPCRDWLELPPAISCLGDLLDVWQKVDVTIQHIASQRSRSLGIELPWDEAGVAC